MENFQESSNKFSLVLIDLDDYGRVNKNHGFLIGDMLLKKFVEAVKNNIKSDLIFRFEGDKFVILFENQDSQKTNKIIRKMADEFKKVKFMSHNIHLSFSASVYTVVNSDENIEKIVDRLYELNREIKSSKKGNIRVVCEEKNENQKQSNKIKILIADDAEIINHIIKAKLEETKYKFFYARDGIEAVSKCRDLKPDLIILDLLMPKMSGFEVCSVLKKDNNTKNIKIIILSSMKKSEDVVKCLKMGVDAYMVKPFLVEELERRIKRILK
jgi:diguanylate cyclase (GGDEF)-like protein